MAAWYIIFNGEQVGPVELRELSKYNLTPDSMVWTEGMPDWRPAAEVPEVAGLLYGAGTYGQQPPYPNGYRRGYNEGFREGYYEIQSGSRRAGYSPRRTRYPIFLSR